LPYDGERPYVPPKNFNRPKRIRGNGFEDIDGNRWTNDRSRHGGPHWDVQHRDGTHTNVDFGGRVIGGAVGDNFPNVPTHNPAMPPWEDASGVQS
jgi:hypothetical protein